jgi:hypothetical protein
MAKARRRESENNHERRRTLVITIAPVSRSDAAKQALARAV